MFMYQLRWEIQIRHGKPLLMDQLRWGDPNKTREAIVDVSAEVGRSK